MWCFSLFPYLGNGIGGCNSLSLYQKYKMTVCVFAFKFNCLLLYIMSVKTKLNLQRISQGHWSMLYIQKNKIYILKIYCTVVHKSDNAVRNRSAIKKKKHWNCIHEVNSSLYYMHLRIQDVTSGLRKRAEQWGGKICYIQNIFDASGRTVFNIFDLFLKAVVMEVFTNNRRTILQFM